MLQAHDLNMAELCSDEQHFFGFATFFDFEIGKSKCKDPENISKTNNDGNNSAYLSPTRLDFTKDVNELCVTWSTIFQLLKGGKVKVCGWSEGGIISADEKIFLPLDEKMVTLRSSWNKLLMISEKGRCHVMRDSHDDWTMHSVTSCGAANEEDPKENTWFTFCDVGDMHSIVVDKEGRAYQIEEDRTVDPFKYLSVAIPFEIRVDQVNCGKEHVLLLNENHGTVYSFGLGSRGQLGHGQVDSEKTPRRVEALTGIQIKQVAAGGWHSLALSEFGDVYSWGWNECGQLGITCVPPEVPSTFYALPYIVDFPGGETVVVCVGCGARHSVAVTSEPEGNIWSWGWGRYGQLGHGDIEDRKTPTLVEYFKNIDSRVMSITCGPWQTIVHTSKTIAT